MCIDISEIVEDFEGFNPVMPAWDCDPFLSIVEREPPIDEEDAESEWQIVALDRWGDKRVNPYLLDGRGKRREW